jgi:BirA family biotin operon repressor/biotin-[acetyl-CoA-carboxylase] ligase
MKELPITNPFGAPVFHEESVSSTMDGARLLAEQGQVHGTVITADFQEAGRGRTPGRSWKSARAQNLMFTILLRYADFSAVPKALTLRAGLAVSRAVEDFAPALADAVRIKWPNDVMIHGGKAAGILTESDGKLVFIGAGINVLQTEFPEACRAKAVSIAGALQKAAFEKPVPAPALAGEDRFRLLEKILARLWEEIGSGSQNHAESWRRRLEERLYLKGKKVRFTAGGADSGKTVEGLLYGIGPEGELILDIEGKPLPFVSGELDVY